MSGDSSYDLVVVGTGFAGSFFLHAYLAGAPPGARVLVLERGRRWSHADYLAHHDRLSREARAHVVRRGMPDKTWNFQFAFGGGSNCWWANTPRMVPADFSLRTRHGVGADWPISYDDLEEHYCRAEELMAISGPAEPGPAPRSRPYPQPPHRMSEPDRLLQAAYPDRFFHMPTARARLTTESGRSRCCSSGVCGACPIDAKFTIGNEMARLYDDPRVTLRLGATAERILRRGDVATGVAYRQDGADGTCRANLVVLAANGIFNPFLMLRSGFDDAALGRGIVEQVSVFVTAYLHGVDNFQGSTSRCGLGYMLHGDDRRGRRAAALVVTHNTPDVTGLRLARGRWRHVLGLTVVFEDLRQDRNLVRMGTEDAEKPEVVFVGRSSYTEEALRTVEHDVERLLAPLPVEGLKLLPTSPTDSHLIGSTVMGTDARTSVLDPDLVHHRVRNLVVLGSGAFPTAAPANPTLTLGALALRSAARLFGGRG